MRTSIANTPLQGNKKHQRGGSLRFSDAFLYSGHPHCTELQVYVHSPSEQWFRNQQKYSRTSGTFQLCCSTFGVKVFLLHLLAALWTSCILIPIFNCTQLKIVTGFTGILIGCVCHYARFRYYSVSALYLLCFLQYTKFPLSKKLQKIFAFCCSSSLL